MNRNKKIFLFFAAIFFLIIAAVSYDMARKTTFPGSKSQLKERIKREYMNDSAKKTADTIKVDFKKQE
jgi:hypothetical protein